MRKRKHGLFVPGDDVQCREERISKEVMDILGIIRLQMGLDAMRAEVGDLADLVTPGKGVAFVAGAVCHP